MSNNIWHSSTMTWQTKHMVISGIWHSWNVTWQTNQMDKIRYGTIQPKQDRQINGNIPVRCSSNMWCDMRGRLLLIPANLLYTWMGRHCECYFTKSHYVSSTFPPVIHYFYIWRVLCKVYIYFLYISSQISCPFLMSVHHTFFLL